MLDFGFWDKNLAFQRRVVRLFSNFVVDEFRFVDEVRLGSIYIHVYIYIWSPPPPQWTHRRP